MDFDGNPFHGAGTLVLDRTPPQQSNRWPSVAVAPVALTRTYAAHENTSVTVTVRSIHGREAALAVCCRQKPCLLPICPPCFSLGQSDRPSRRDCQTASANLTCASTALAVSTVTEQETSKQTIRVYRRVIQVSRLALEAMVVQGSSSQPHCRSHGTARPASNHLPGAG